MKTKVLIPIVLSGLLVTGGLAWRWVVPSITKNAEQGSSRSASQFTSPADVLHYLNVHVSRLPRTEVDKYLLRLLSLQDARRKSYEAQLFSDTLNPRVNRISFEELNHPEGIKDAEIRHLLQGILGDGFRLAMPEGMLCFTSDFPVLMQKYGRYASARMKEYLGFMEEETARPYSEDAGLLIVPDELARRIVFAERFVASYPHFARVAEVERLHGQYLTAYLIGLDNTPAFDYATDRLNNNFRNSFRSTAAKYKGTGLAHLISNYLTVLQRNDYRKTKAVLDFAARAVTLE